MPPGDVVIQFEAAQHLQEKRGPEMTRGLCENTEVFGYLRRRKINIPARPRPARAIVEGSGTPAAWVKTNAPIFAVLVPLAACQMA